MPNLQRIMVDRARIISKEFGPRVHGETVIFDKKSEWISCRIDPDRFSERKGGGRTAAERLHQFICLLKDQKGASIVLKVSDKLEIEKFLSAGTFTSIGTFEVATVMKPRSIKKDILFVADIKKLEEH